MKALRATADTFSNELCIEESQNSDAKCKKCSKNIRNAEPRVTFKRFYSHSYYFHLQCFTPITKVRIEKSDPGIVIKTKKVRERVDEWIDEWNKQFSVSPEALAVWGRKAVRSAPPARRKAMIEVAKFLDLRSLVAAGGVSKGWYHVAWEDDAWRDAMHREFPRPSSASPLRSEFIRLWLSACAHCKKILSDPERHMLCPLTSRPKCVQCYSDRQHRPQRITWVKKSHGMTPQLLKQLNINVFSFDGHDCIYINDAMDKVTKHRKLLAMEIAKKETAELDEIFGKEFFDVLKRADAKEFVDEKTFENCVAGRTLTGNQKGLLDFVMAGRMMNKFNDFLAKVKTAIAVNFDASTDEGANQGKKK